MPIQGRCASCQKKFKAPDKLAGKKVKCPQCGGVIAVPVPKPKAEPPSPVASLLDEEDIPIQGESGPKQDCPACGASIGAAAVVCVECGYDFRSGAKLETEHLDDAPAPMGVGADRAIGFEDEKTRRQLPQGLAFLRGFGFASLCAFIAALMWAAFIYFTHIEVGMLNALLAIGLGAFTGMGMAFGYGHEDIFAGAGAAFITLVGVIGTRVLIFMAVMASAMADFEPDVDGEMMGDEYAAEAFYDEEEWDEEEWSEEDIAAAEEWMDEEYENEELTPEEIAQMEAQFAAEMEEMEPSAGSVVGELVLLAFLFGFWHIVILFFACGTAYQVATQWHPEYS